MGYKKDLLVMAVYAGEIMLKNGAETYRVEDTLVRLCKSRGFSYVETFVIPTGIFLCLDNKNTSEEMTSYIKRIRSRSNNLNKIAMVNEFSRIFVDSDMEVAEGMEKLKEIDRTPSYSTLTRVLFGSIASGSFALLFQSTVPEALLAFLAGMILTFILTYLNNVKLSLFLSNIVGGFILASTAVMFSNISPNIDIDNIIIGAIMIMVPGVAMTNAIRDSILGDLSSGLARAAEALIIAISIAFGVGTGIELWSILGGVLL